MKEKILIIYIRGNRYEINMFGQFRRTDIKMDFSDNWLFVGGTRHHWSRHIDVNLTDAFVDPKKLIGCLLTDKDHGSMRQWGGCYCGKLPRIRGAYLE